MTLTKMDKEGIQEHEKVLAIHTLKKISNKDTMLANVKQSCLRHFYVLYATVGKLHRSNCATLFCKYE